MICKNHVCKELNKPVVLSSVVWQDCVIKYCFFLSFFLPWQKKIVSTNFLCKYYIDVFIKNIVLFRIRSSFNIIFDMYSFLCCELSLMSPV